MSLPSRNSLAIARVLAYRPRAASGAVPAIRSAPARHVFFALAAFALLMSSIDTTIVAVAVPQLTTALDAPLVWVSWTLTAYQLVQVIMQPLAGKLSDSLGRKPVFLFCVGTFTLGSLLCGLAPSIWLLIAARALQAIGGGGLMPSAVGIISDQYREGRAQARGLFTSVMPIGAIVGPNLGGFILERWGWREMFFINVPIGIVVVAGVALMLKGDGRRRSHHFDLPGLALYSGALVILLAAMSGAADDPSLWHNPLPWGALVASVVLAAIFLRYIRRAADPVMEYQLVVRQPFLAANLYSLLYGAAVYGYTAFVPTYAVVHYGMNAFLSGAVLTPRAFAMIGTSLLCSLWIIRLGYRWPMAIGMSLTALSLLLLGMGWTALQIGPLSLSGFWLMASLVAISGFGMGLSGPASGNAVLDLAPEKAAALTGIRGMFRLTGGALCIAAIVLALTFFPDQNQGLGVVFIGLGILVLSAITMAMQMPDSARERHKAARGTGSAS